MIKSKTIYFKILLNVVSSLNLITVNGSLYYFTISPEINIKIVSNPNFGIFPNLNQFEKSVVEINEIQNIL